MTRTDPPEMTSRDLLSRLTDSETDLDSLFERLLGHASVPGADEDTPVFRAVVPGEVLAAGGNSLAEFLGSVLAEVHEIEEVVAGLGEADSTRETSPLEAVAFVSERELADPEALSRALAPLQTDRARFEFFFETARAALERLDVYRLSRMSATELVTVLQDQENAFSLQYVVELLRSLHRAADSFEALELPRPHIRDYLQHLYQMRNWNEMGRLVRMLEAAVSTQLARMRDAGTHD